MQKQYNLYNLEPSFKKYLLTENISPISLKNYMSDFRHFAGWVNVIANKVKQPQNIGETINSQAIGEYRSYLTTNNIPHKTINRRLSTIRKFCSFCISQGWMKENPAKQIINISPLSSRVKARDLPNNILSQFANDLEKEKMDQSVITSYLDDVRDFLKI